MSDSDAYEDEMRIFSSIGDRDQDRVLAGRTEAVGDDLRELAAFCQEARTLFVNAPSESTAVRHLAEIAAAARIVADRDGAMPSRVVGERIPGVAVKSRRRVPFASLGPRLALAGAGVALLAAFAGGALAGVLPGAIQHKVAGIARNVGLSLPDGRTHPPPIDTGSRPKAAPAKPSAGHGGTGAADTETTQSGGDQTTQQSTGDETTQQSAGDGAIQGSGDQTTQTGTEGSGTDSTDTPRQPSATGTPPASSGSKPEGDGIPSDGGSPAVTGDTPAGGNPAGPGDGSDRNG